MSLSEGRSQDPLVNPTRSAVAPRLMAVRTDGLAIMRILKALERLGHFADSTSRLEEIPSHELRSEAEHARRASVVLPPLPSRGGRRACPQRPRAGPRLVPRELIRRRFTMRQRRPHFRASMAGCMIRRQTRAHLSPAKAQHEARARTVHPAATRLPSRA